MCSFTKDSRRFSDSPHRVEFPGRPVTWTALCLVAVAGLLLLSACSTIPRKYQRAAEPGVTLTDLTHHPSEHHGKVVILGGTRLDDTQREGHVWIHLRNRPLDEAYRPHLPENPESREGGTFWVTAPDRSDLPPDYRKWARMTVVGRVIGWTGDGKQAPSEPVLGLIYVRGWGLSPGQEGSWENVIDPNYLLSTPRGLLAPRHTQTDGEVIKDQFYPPVWPY